MFIVAGIPFTYTSPLQSIYNDIIIMVNNYIGPLLPCNINAQKVIGQLTRNP